MTQTARLRSASRAIGLPAQKRCLPLGRRDVKERVVRASRRAVCKKLSKSISPSSASSYGGRRLCQVLQAAFLLLNRSVLIYKIGHRPWHPRAVRTRSPVSPSCRQSWQRVGRTGSVCMHVYAVSGTWFEFDRNLGGVVMNLPSTSPTLADRTALWRHRTCSGVSIGVRT